jgi:polyferredoxin
MGRHQETPSYVTEVPGWLKKFQGKPLGEPVVGKGGVDVISSATVTCQAIKKILEISRTRAAKEVFRLKLAGRPKAGTAGAKSIVADPKLWVVALLLALSVFAYLRATPYLRLFCLAGSAGVLGFWLNLPLTTVDLALLSQWAVPGTAVKILAVAAAFGLALLMGQIWCGYNCPFGALQEFVWLAVHPAGLRAEESLGQARRAEPNFEQSARYVKFMVLCATLVCFWITADQVFLLFDPMVWVFQLEAHFWKIALLAVLFAGSLAFFRPWCRYLCPVGAVLALGNKISLLDRWTSKRRVGKCDLGVTFAGHAECIRCNRCVRTDDRKI